MRRVLTAGLVIAVGVALGACSSSKRSTAAIPPAPPVVTVTMEDGSFRYDQAVPNGRVVFQARNLGTLVHNIVLLPLSEDVPPINEQLRGQERRAAQPFAGVRPVRPGDSREFAVDLEPGRRYGMICTITDAEGKSHALKGQNSEFRAGGSPPGQPAPPGGASRG